MKTENYTLLQRITRKLDAKLGSGGLGDIVDCVHQMGNVICEKII